MKLVYVNKEKFNKIVEAHFNRFKNFNNIDVDILEIYGYNKLHILFNQNNNNYILWDFIADEIEEEYKEHFYKFKEIKHNYIIGGYLDIYNDIMYCTDTNFIPNTTDNTIYEVGFINYLIERC